MESLPEDIKQALHQAPDAEACFTALPPSHKAEYLTWIAEAKKPPTRARRVAGMIERLRACNGAAAAGNQLT